VWGANMAHRRSAIEGMRFDPALGPSPSSAIRGEEVEFTRRLRARGEKVLWCPFMRVRHYVDPSRMTLGYLRRLARGFGEERVLVDGIPGGPRMFGIPRWLLRFATEEYARAWVARLSRDRAGWLTHLKQYEEARGRITGCRRGSAR
jgi:GT2 family glycosyltransferase